MPQARAPPRPSPHVPASILRSVCAAYAPLAQSGDLRSRPSTGATPCDTHLARARTAERSAYCGVVDDFDAELDEVLRRIDEDLHLPDEESAGAAVDVAATVAAVQRDLDEACVAIERAQRRLARVVGLRSFERELRLTPPPRKPSPRRRRRPRRRPSGRQTVVG